MGKQVLQEHKKCGEAARKKNQKPSIEGCSWREDCYKVLGQHCLKKYKERVGSGIVLGGRRTRDPWQAELRTSWGDPRQTGFAPFVWFLSERQVISQIMPLWMTSVPQVWLGENMTQTWSDKLGLRPISEVQTKPQKNAKVIAESSLRVLI